MKPRIPTHRSLAVSPRLNSDSRGFTLIELIVIIATIAILAGMLLPALGKASQKGLGLQCLGNLRQLGIGWQLYAAENNDRLAANNGAAPPEINWVAGSLSPIRNNRDNTNQMLIRKGLLYPYVGAIGAYKCPSDRSMAAFTGGTFPRVRSMSMSGWLGCANQAVLDWLRTEFGPGYGLRLRLSDLVNPAPADTWVFLDEREETLDDGWFGVHLKKSAWRSSWPGSYHQGAGNLAFADGHCETKRWVDPRTRPAIEKNGSWEFDAVQPGNPDIRWLQERTTERP